MLIALLAAEGRIPEPPADVMALSQRKRRRVPTAAEAGAYTWIVASDGDPENGKILGVLAYRDTFDFHTATDVREVVYVAGPATPRIIRWLERDTARRIVGAIDLGNERMKRALVALGYTATRVVFEKLA
jgi:hypothetical protein